MLFPTANLLFPFNGGLISQASFIQGGPDCAGQRCFEVVFNDVNGVGLNENTIRDALPEFEVWVNGVKVTTMTVNNVPTRVVGKINTWLYSWSGTAPDNGIVEIRFLANAFTDNSGVGNMAETERFFVVSLDSGGNPIPPGPVASLASPMNGEALSAADLNARRYIDITFTSLDGTPIDKASIEDIAPEFTMSGPGILDLMVDATGAPVLVGLPLLISGRGADATAVTYRFFFKDRNKTNAIDLFGPGAITVSFLGWGVADPSHPVGRPAWNTQGNGFDSSTPTDTTGWNIRGLTQGFTLSPAAGGGLTAGGPIALGPLSLQGPTIGIADVGFADGMLVLTIALGVNRASLDFNNKTPVANGSATPPPPAPTGGSQSGSGITVDLIGLQGTFDLAIDALGLLSGNVRIEPTGKWGVRIASLEAEIPNVATLTAEGIVFGYDPNHDPANGPQELLRISTAKITFPSLGVTGSLRPYDPTAGRNVNAPDDGQELAASIVPGLIVYDNGFKIGTAELAYGLPPFPPGQALQPGNELSSTQSAVDRDINLFGILKLDDLRVGVQGLSVTFGDGDTDAAFTGTIYIATGGAALFPGKAFTATLTDRTTADDTNPDGTQNTEAFRAQLTFNHGRVESFQLEMDTLSIRLGQFVTLTSRNFRLNTGATATQYLVQFQSVAATIKIGGLEIGGEARNFGFLGDGSFKAGNGFGVFVSVGSATGDSFKWPAFLPVRIDAIGIEWEDVENHPEDFVILLSASVTGIKGLDSLEFSGSIVGVRIQPSLLAEGKFPIIGIDSLAVTVRGKMFGGEINAGLVGGIMRLDSNYQAIGDFDRTTPVHQRVFYLGLQGGFSMAGMAGFTIRIGLSELGPLQVFLNVQLPTGILLVPQIGLTLNDFSAGVEFFKSLPSIDDPFALRNAAFALPTNMTADQWLVSLKQQVALQARTLSQNPSMSGFEAAFKAPMTFTGSARIYSLFTSQAVFNGRVTIMISTDGKFMIHGQLNFADNNLSISGRLYADLSRVSSGNVVILFLADIPDQIQILTLYGKIKMGFKDATGQDVSFTVPDEGGTSTGGSTTPVVEVVTPASGNVDVAVLRTILDSGDQYLDVMYQAAPGATINWLQILKGTKKPTVMVGGNGVVAGTSRNPTTVVPMIAVTTPTGLEVVRLRTRATTIGDDDDPGFEVYYVIGTTETSVLKLVTTDADEALAAAMRVTGSTRIRYLLGTAAIPLGVVTVSFAANDFHNADVGSVTGLGNVAFTHSFTVTGTTVVVSDPGAGGSIDVNVINNRGWIDVLYHFPDSVRINLRSITDLAAEFTLSGPGLGSIVLDPARAPDAGGHGHHRRHLHLPVLALRSVGHRSRLAHVPPEHLVLLRHPDAADHADRDPRHPGHQHPDLRPRRRLGAYRVGPRPRLDGLPRGPVRGPRPPRPSGAPRGGRNPDLRPGRLGGDHRADRRHRGR